ncbi:MAG TPA: TetR/AcrR family transcriptional regulator [Pseudonocardiaceae bacterium]|jgi:AcrR family transcriptional regulator|nr:TetR/AcrR family transcriptional regulator [Pseudonocardiaceae bacterium]
MAGSAPVRSVPTPDAPATGSGGGAESGQTTRAETRSSGRRDYGGRTASQRRAERRDRLMKAGLELFGTEGYPAVSIERLCATANVSTRNFYEEFPSREALLIALHEQNTVRAYEAVLAAVADALDAPMPERVSRAIRAYVSTAAADPRWTRIAFVEVVGVSPAVEAHRIQWRERLSQLVEAEAQLAISRGEATNRSFKLTSMAFFGAVNELVYNWSNNGRQVPLEDICAELTRLAVAVLTAP